LPVSARVRAISNFERQRAIRYTLPLLLFILSFVFYLATLAPTVLWGDDAYLARTAYESLSQPVYIDHWLWVQYARWFIHLPWGDVAYRVNLSSAVAGALTISLLYIAGRSIHLSQGAATAAALSLAVSHTFWTHAVRAEVYTLYTVLMLLQLWFWFHWRSDRPWPLYAAALLSGLTLLGHQMALLLAPGAAVLLWQQRTWLTRRQFVWLIFSLLVGALFFVTVVWLTSNDQSLPAALQDHFTHEEIFSNALFDFSFATFPRDLALWLGFLGLQFIGPAGLLGLWGGYCVLRIAYYSANTEYGIRNTFLVLYAASVFFAFSYHVNDQYAFFLPSYVVFAFFVGWGWDNVFRIPYSVEENDASRITHHALRNTQYAIGNTLLLLGLVAIPIASYAALPRVLSAAEFNPLGIRELPGRDPYTFFLWPGKQGYTGAADYGRTALALLPPNAILLADHTPRELFWYLQRVEGLRPDVILIKVAGGADIRPIVVVQPADRPIFLADINAKYYNLSQLKEARIEPVGPIYRLLIAR
jgi:hypothetical protein